MEKKHDSNVANCSMLLLIQLPRSKFVRVRECENIFNVSKCILCVQNVKSIYFNMWCAFTFGKVRLLNRLTPDLSNELRCTTARDFLKMLKCFSPHSPPVDNVIFFTLSPFLSMVKSKCVVFLIHVIIAVGLSNLKLISISQT